MREAPTIFVAVLFSMSQPAKADVRVAADAGTEPLCGRVRMELEQIGVAAAIVSSAGSARRARRRAFSDTKVDALVICRLKPMRIEAFYPDGTRLGGAGFVVIVPGDDANTPVYVSERIRAERFVADAPKPVPFAPALWWLGVGGDVLLSPGRVAPVGLVTLDVGYRFHRHWSLQAFASIQPYMRRLNESSTETRLRFDEFGAGLAYHPVVTKRVDLALGVRAAVARLGVRGRGTGSSAELEGQRDRAWLGFPAGRISLGVGLTKRLWLRAQADVGALLPKAVVAAGPQLLGSLGTFAAKTGLSLEVNFR